jgi:glycosyltransferase involved in cell wall biosynthesis
LQEKKRIALITTWFPPHYGVATNRMLAFAEYLSDTYEVEVFALDEHVHEHLWKNSIRVHYASPNRLFSRLKSNRNDGRIVHHFKTLLRVLLSKVVSNPLRKWQQLATQQLMKRHEEQAFDVLISSFSPHEAHLVALAFCRQFPGIPWIADMRDEMSFNLNHSAATNAEMRRIEQQINQYASAVTSVSAPILSEYKKHLPDVPIAEEIRNGFNHELQFEDATDSRSVFQFGYFGSFYGDIKPDHFFRALNLVPEQEGYEVHIFGAFANFSIPAGLKERVHMHMSLPY